MGISLHNPGCFLDMHTFKGIQQPKRLQQPYYKDNHYDDVQEAFDLAIHGDISVNKPESNANNN
jgi:hypothetical protein